MHISILQMEKVNLRRDKYPETHVMLWNTDWSGLRRHPRLPASSMLRIPAHQRSSVQCHWLLLLGETDFLTWHLKDSPTHSSLNFNRVIYLCETGTHLDDFQRLELDYCSFVYTNDFAFTQRRVVLKGQYGKNGLYLKSVRWDFQPSVTSEDNLYKWRC